MKNVYRTFICMAFAVFGVSISTTSFAAGAKPPNYNGKYIFDPSRLSELQYQANLEVDAEVGFNPTESEIDRLKDPAHAGEFVQFLKERLQKRHSVEARSQDYPSLLRAAVNSYQINHDAVLWENVTDSGVFQGTTASGHGSYEVYANDLFIEYRMEEVMRVIHRKLKELYPGQILEKIEWPFNNVGGIYARLGILYCSPTEYLAFFATTTDQSGFSGVYPQMTVADIMFSGLMIGEHRKYYWPMKKGWSYLDKKVNWTYEMHDFAGMLDLGQGNITAAFWQGVISPAFQNHDFSSMNKQLAACVKSMLLRAWNKVDGK